MQENKQLETAVRDLQDDVHCLQQQLQSEAPHVVSTAGKWAPACGQSVGDRPRHQVGSLLRSRLPTALLIVQGVMKLVTQLLSQLALENYAAAAREELEAALGLRNAGVKAGYLSPGLLQASGRCWETAAVHRQPGMLHDCAPQVQWAISSDHLPSHMLQRVRSAYGDTGAAGRAATPLVGGMLVAVLLPGAMRPPAC